MTLLDILRTSDLAQCLPGLQVRVTTEGITMNLPWAFADLPMFIAGLGLELTLGPGEWEGPLRQPRIPDPIIQVFLWGSPALDPIQRESVFRMVHSWIRDEPSHDFLLPMARYEGHRPPCAWLVADLDAQVEVADPFPVRELVLKGEPGCLHAWRDKLFAAGAVAGSGGLTLGAIRLNHAHPEALLLQLFRQDADLAGAFHPDLVPFQERFRREVLAAESPEPYRAAWSLLEDLQRQGWILPLPS